MMALVVTKNSEEGQFQLYNYYHGNLRGPPQCYPPPRNKALMRTNSGTMMVSSPLRRPAISWGGWHWGGPLRFPKYIRKVV